MPPVRLALAKDLARHLRGGHPWVFRKALERPPRLPAGAIVDVADGDGFVARGYYDPASPIAVRVLTRDAAEAVDLDFFRRRIAAAAALRRAVLPAGDPNAYRLVHGESDGLPAMVVDRYADFAVLKLYSAGIAAHRSMLVEALVRAVSDLRGVVGRDEVGRDDLSGDEDRGAGRILAGQTAPELLPIVEGGARFLVDVYRGQKTGFFLDQRDNRALLRSLAKDREVLNAFAYTGGFSVASALGGARTTMSVDRDADAIALARRNFAENGLDPTRHEFLAADVFDVLARFKAEGRDFDLVVLDPPAFAKSQKAVRDALDGYARLNRSALALLRPLGLLATASCSARVSALDFLDAVRQAAAKSRADLQLLYERFQPPDHPASLAFPEGKYLKFFIFRRVGSDR